MCARVPRERSSCEEDARQWLSPRIEATREALAPPFLLLLFLLSFGARRQRFSAESSVFEKSYAHSTKDCAKKGGDQTESDRCWISDTHEPPGDVEGKQEEGRIPTAESSIEWHMGTKQSVRGEYSSQLSPPL